MPALGNPSLHFFMTRGMARQMGVSLGDALSDGRLSAQAYANMVTRCRACLFVHQCQKAMAEAQGQRDAPEYCPNAKALKQLRLN